MHVWWRFRHILLPYRGRLIATFMATLSRPLLNAAKIYLLKLIVDNLVADPSGNIVLVICGGYLVIALAKGAATYVDQYLGAYVGGRVVLDLRQQLFNRFTRLSLRYHHEHRVGESISRLISDVGAVEDVLVASITDGLTQVLTVIIFTGMLFYLDPSLALVALIIVPFLFVSFLFYAGRTRTASREVRVRLAELTATVEEAFASIALVKIFMRHDQEHKHLRERGEQHWQARLVAAQQRAIFAPLSDIIATVGTVFVVYFGAQALANHTLTIGGLVIFLAYLGQMYTPLQSLSRLGNNLQGGIAAAERVVAILDAPATDDEPHAATLPWQRRSPAQVAQEDAIVFDRVRFAYQPDRPILQSFSLRVPRGAIVALVGASGGGKSTAVSLLQRFYDPDGGSIRFLGHDVREYDTEHLRGLLAVVPQETLLLMGSVRDNIIYGNNEADAQAVMQATRAAGFPEQRLGDAVGPRGTMLSGGQRQRVAIARALVRLAPVLVLDEATAALDALAEEHLRTTLLALRGRHTILLVAHRLSTVRSADLIAVVDGGRVVEVGTHSALLAQGGMYTAMVQAQSLTDMTIQSTQVMPIVQGKQIS